MGRMFHAKQLDTMQNIKKQRNIVYFSRTKILSIGILVGEIHLIVTNDTSRAFKEACLHYEGVESETSGISVVKIFKNGMIIIVLNINSTPEIVAHECFHVVNFALDYKGAYIIDSTPNEAHAYYFGKTFSEVSNAFLKIKKQFEKRIVKK